jgi:Uma2 family endonuclease
VSDPAKRRATYDDLLAVPDHLVAEIIVGELVTNPRPAVRHARASSRLAANSAVPSTKAKADPAVGSSSTSRNVLVPDLAGWRRERMPELPDTAAIELPPDWVCEVLSSNRAVDRVDKMNIYAREKVAYVWLVDPSDRSLEVFRLDGASYRVIASGAVRCHRAGAGGAVG